MPFPIVYGIPKGTPVIVVSQIRRYIVRAVADNMNCSPTIVTPFFPKDWLDGPVDPEQDGGQAIYITLDTGMLHGKPAEEADKLAAKLTAAVAQVVFDSFGGMIEVECFIGDLNGKWKTLLKPMNDSDIVILDEKS